MSSQDYMIYITSFFLQVYLIQGHLNPFIIRNSICSFRVNCTTSDSIKNALISDIQIYIFNASFEVIYDKTIIFFMNETIINFSILTSNHLLNYTRIYPFTFNVIINTTDVLLSFAHARRKNLSVYKITNLYVFSSTYNSRTHIQRHSLKLLCACSSSFWVHVYTTCISICRSS